MFEIVLIAIKCTGEAWGIEIRNVTMTIYSRFPQACTRRELVATHWFAFSLWKVCF